MLTEVSALVQQKVMIHKKFMEEFIMHNGMFTTVSFWSGSSASEPSQPGHQQSSMVRWQGGWQEAEHSLEGLACDAPLCLQLTELL